MLGKGPVLFSPKESPTPRGEIQEKEWTNCIGPRKGRVIVFSKIIIQENLIRDYLHKGNVEEHT